MLRYSLILLFTASLCVSPAHAGIEAPATASLMIQKQGPRAGAPGRTYMNIQGKATSEEGKYASYAVLEVKAAKPEAKPAAIRGATLHLVQSIPRFANDGVFEVWLVTEDGKALTPDAAPDWKFEPEKSGGVADSLNKGVKVARTSFKQVKTGTIDTLKLDLDDKAKAFLLGRVVEGKAIRFFLTPVDPEVAACYFGLGANNEESRPKLILDVQP